LREVVLVVAAYALYAWVRGQVGANTSPADKARAVGHAEHVVAWERSLGLFQEGEVQRALLRWPWSIRFLDTFWSYAYLVVTLAVIVWLLARHFEQFGRLRTALFVTTIVSVGIFALFPTVPPRLLPSSYHVVDTWSKIGGIAGRNPPRLEHISDPFASMPSLHVAWSVWCAVAVTSLSRRTLVRVAAWLYPALTVLAVVATGNHYVLDCVAGALLMLVTLRATPAISGVLSYPGTWLAGWRDRRLGLGDGDIAQVLSESRSIR
jgi:hypothetical protein